MTVKRHHRFVGGEHNDDRTPIWVWQQELTGLKEVRLPIVPKPRITVYDDEGEIPCSVYTGPDYEVYELRTIPLTRGSLGTPIYLECWVAVGLPDGDARELTFDVLFKEDSP